MLTQELIERTDSLDPYSDVLTVEDKDAINERCLYDIVYFLDICKISQEPMPAHVAAHINALATQES